ncbi:MAG: hypothetical protein NVSMB14_14880 [Isosphaeraceae bacterium]
MKFGEDSAPRKRTQFSIAKAMIVIAILGVIFSFGMGITIGMIIVTIGWIVVVPRLIAASKSNEPGFVGDMAMLGTACALLLISVVVLISVVLFVSSKAKPI